MSDNNTKEDIIKDFAQVVEQMKLDDIEENPESEYLTFDCSSCAKTKPLAGSIQYSQYRLCNDCVLMYELALKFNKVKNIDEFMLITEDKRLSELCDFIKKDSLKEKN